MLATGLWPRRARARRPGIVPPPKNISGAENPQRPLRHEYLPGGRARADRV